MLGKRPYTVVLIIPTGVGAAIGGYGGDAIPVARAMAQVADCLITHPNVLNGAQLYWNLPNALYVEGFGLDQFAAGQWGLRPVQQNSLGLVLDQAIEPELRVRQLQAADAARATLGLTLTDYVVTDAPLAVSLNTAPSGATWGTLQRADSLLRAVEKLIDQAGATAIAVVARFPDTPADNTDLQAYRYGQGVDPLAGAEAVISHLVVRQFQIPCAHAPALAPLPLDAHISPRSAAEELGYTFLPSVLVGLSRAPQLISSDAPQPGDIWADQVDAVVLPATAWGGKAVMHLGRSLGQRQTPPLMLAVEENTTRMRVPPAVITPSVVTVRSYLEAIGALAAHKAGIDRGALNPVIPSLKQLEDC